MADMGLAGMGGAAGAGDAIQQLFQQRMQQAQLATQQDEFQQRQAQQDALTRLKFQELAEAAKQRLEISRQAAEDRATVQNRLTFPLLPRTGLDAGTVDQMTTGPGALPPALFPPTPVSQPAPPPGIAAPDQPTGDQPIPGTIANSPMPQARTFTRVPTPQEAEQERKQNAIQQLTELIPAGSPDRALALRMMAAGVTPPAGFFDKQTTHLVPVAGPHGPTYVNEASAEGQPVYEKPQPVATVTIQTTDPNTGQPVTQVLPKSEAIGKTFGRPEPANIQQQKTNATNVMAHIDDIRKEADNLNKAGLIGPIGGRWGDFMAGKVGSSEFTTDPKIAEQLTEFRADLGLLKSGMAMVHGGARGGGSPAIMARMDALINANKMDLPLLTGALNSFQKWLKQYAGTGAAATTAPKVVRYDMSGNVIP